MASLKFLKNSPLFQIALAVTLVVAIVYLYRYRHLYMVEYMEDEDYDSDEDDDDSDEDEDEDEGKGGKGKGKGGKGKGGKGKGGKGKGGKGKGQEQGQGQKKGQEQGQGQRKGQGQGQGPSGFELGSGELLPMSDLGSWSDVHPGGIGALENKNFLNSGHHVGINMIGQSLRNANQSIRSEPANPQKVVSPWINSTIVADELRRPLEIGMQC